MAVRINVDKIVYGSPFQKLYDDVFYNLAEKLFEERHFTIEEYVACKGYRGFVVRDSDGFLSAVSATFLLNNEPVSFMFSDDIEGEDVDSVLSLYCLFEDSHCKRYYNLDISLFEQGYLLANNIGVPDDAEVIYGDNGNADKSLYVAWVELKSEDYKQMALFL